MLGNSITPTPIGDEGDSPNSRTAYYTNLKALTDSPTYQSLIGKVTLVTPPLNAAEARADWGLFLSLYYLTPFAFKTDGSIAADAQLTIAHPDLATQFKEDKLLTPEQIANGEANFSDLYLADRAAMLSWVNKLNSEDFTDPNNGFGYISNAPSQHFEDKSSGQMIDINKISNTKRYFIFGENIGPVNTDAITGGDNSDHLYGMAGADTLNGGKGSDWLEGGADDDTLNGEDDADTLLGGTGADTLNGGKGNDQLKGGAGNDTYIHNTNDGNDIIIDSDGLGKIIINGSTSPLNGGDQIANTQVWKSTDQQTRYTKYDQGDGKYTLNILLANGETLFVKDWQDGNLGITLPDNFPQDPPPSGTTITDNSDMIFASDASEQIDSGSGNDILIATAREKFTLNGGVGDDLILGAGNLYIDTMYDSNDTSRVSLTPSSNTDHASKAWRDIQGAWQYDDSAGSDQTNYLASSVNLGSFWKLTGTDSQYGTVSTQTNGIHHNLFTYAPAFSTPNEEITEILLGGTGNDLISGSYDADYIDGGSDNDVLYGNAGNDFMFGGQGQDFADGGNGSDYIDGGAENDVLVGGYGDDVIHGGTGDDDITGDLLSLGGTNPAAPPTATDFSLMGNDTLDGGAGNDKLWGGGGADTLLGGADDDELVGDGIGTPSAYEGADFLDGGAGNDKLWGDGKGDFLYGGEGDDTIYGDSSEIPDAANGDDYIDGGIGNDYLLGQGGKDTLYGGDGNDTLFGDADQVAIAFHGNDYLDGGNGNDQLQGGGGNDTLLGGAGDDVLYGEEGDDSVNGGSGSDQLVGGDGDDTLDGGAGVDGLWGEAGNDTLIGTGGTKDANGNYTGGDVLYGGEGDDTYYIQAGDIVDDTQGSNIINANVGASDLQLAGSILAIGTGNGDYIFIQNALTGGENNLLQLGGNAINQADLIEAGLTTVVNLTTTTQFAVGGKQNDILTAGTTIGTTLRGGAGNDTLTGNAGDDILKGGAGDDTINGNAGNDQIDGGVGVDYMAGGAGNDVYQVDSVGDIVVESVDTGIDIVESSVTYTLSNQLENLTLIGLAAINGAGNELNNILIGNNAANILEGGLGNDALQAGAGDDVLEGGTGDDNLQGDAGEDLLNGGTGDDIMVGGSGNDTYTLSMGDGFDSIEDTQGLNQINFGTGITRASVHASQYQGDDGSYYLLVNYGTGTDKVAIKDGLAGGIQSYRFEDGTVITHAELIGAEGVPFHVYGTPGPDTLAGANNGDTLEGKAGDDQLLGLGGDDNLFGDSGADTLIGGAGNDLLDGGLGDDHLEGGAGQDSYVMRWGMGQDTVIDGADGELNMIKLDAGISISDLASQRNGDDLFLHFKGNEEGLFIKNYYLVEQQWDISTGSVTTTVSDFIANLGADNQAHINQIISNYESRVKALYYQTLGQDGYLLGADGLMHKAETQFTSNSATSYQYNSEFTVVARQSDVAEIEANSTPYHSTLNLLSSSVSTRIISGGFSHGYGASLESGGAVFYPFGHSQVLNIPSGWGVVNVGTGTWFFPPNYFSAPVSTIYSYYTDSYRVDSTLSLEIMVGGSLDNTIETHGYSVVDGGSGNDYISARWRESGWQSVHGYYDTTLYDNPYDTNDVRDIGALLYGNAGNDKIIGSSSNDILIGGDGSDYIDGGSGADAYFISAGEFGKDIITDSGFMSGVQNSDSELVTSSYMNWYYLSLGITDWEDRYYGWSGFTQGEGLPPLPVISPTDYAKLAPLYAAGIIEKDTVEFGSGIVLTDMSFSWGQVPLLSDTGGLYWPNPNFIATLDISWGADQGVRIDMPLVDVNSMDNVNASGSAWYLGTGVEQFKFADGTVLSMAQMLRFAPPMPTVDSILFDVGLGQVAASYLWKSEIRFGANINPTDIIIGRDGVDLLLSHVNGADQLRIQDWYANSNSPSLIQAKFSDNTRWDNAYLTDQGLHLPLIGSTGDDTLVGLRGYTNTIQGLDGNDTIYGGGASDQIHGDVGNDVLYGGAGSDVYYADIGGGHDVIHENDPSASDVDTIYFNLTSDNLVLQRNQTDLVLVYGNDSVTIAGWYGTNGHTIEQIQFSNGVIWDSDYLNSRSGYAPFVGTAGDDVFTGIPDRSNTMSGLDGNDTIYGGDSTDELLGGTGNDTMVGGLGGDYYEVDSPDDVILENLDEGFDWVSSSITYTLSANIEELDLSGTDAINGTGNESDNDIYGNDAANILTGDAGNDWLDGGSGDDTLVGGNGGDTLDGGAGVDLMQGGAGNDIYMVDDANDLVIEELDGGIDTVQVNVVVQSWQPSSTVYTLGANVENGIVTAPTEPPPIIVTATGATTTSGSLYGNALDNTLHGAAAISNYLYGNAGNDRLYGGNYQDMLVGGDGDDYIDGGAGSDNIAYHTANTGVTVNLSITDAQNTIGAGIDTLLNVENILGSSYDDTLTGNAANNRFQSMGGNDVIDGGDGAFDLIEFTNVYAAVNVNMADWTIQSTNMQRIGTLTLSNIEGVGGSIYNDTLTGSSGADYLNGYAGSDIIDGGDGDDYLAGGSSADTITGGAGKDTFILASDRGLGIQNSVDTITDFNLTDDMFQLINADFKALIGMSGTLASNYFVAGANQTTASDADDYIIYNSTNGNVFYDADGSGSNYSSVLIADISDGLNLTHSHFKVSDSVFVV